MISFLYNLFILIYYFAIRVAALYNPKARLWISGRKNILKKLATSIDSQDKIVWFHAASLGEFEQGRPLIEAFRNQNPDFKILLTFFSPSGYEIRKNYNGADYIVYLPLDTRKNALQFIHIVQPKFVVFIKYEFWYNFIKALSGNGIPVFFASVIFRKEQHFFKWYGGWFRKILRKVSFFFVQNEESENLLNSIGIHQVTISGDTRFDRVYNITQKVKEFPLVKKFTMGNKVLLAGSTWPKDELLIEELIKQNASFKIIIAPHEVNRERIDSLIKRFALQNVVKYSEADETISKARILIIDGMGFLSGLYQYCNIAYIGGGFGAGIHNILEAATFGKPVIFGPNYQRFAEAVDLIQLKGAFSINTSAELINTIGSLFDDESKWQTSSSANQEYVKKKKGATAIILSRISEIVSSC